MPSQEWEIKPRAVACARCEKPFVKDQVYVSSLRLKDADYERSDCCESCWNNSPLPEAFSVWRGSFQPEVRPPEVLKKETAESLLRKLIAKNDPQNRNAIFILAVMLERRRMLSEKEVQQKEGMDVVRIYEHRKSGDIFIVSDPMLSLDQLGHVQAEVAALLSGSETGDLPPQEAPPAAPPASAQAL